MHLFKYWKSYWKLDLMVRGIATDNKRYKHIKRSDEKWLCKDLQVFKRTVEKYIDDIRPNGENEIKKIKKRI